jgi:hypothetical protein
MWLQQMTVVALVYDNHTEQATLSMTEDTYKRCAFVHDYVPDMDAISSLAIN